MPRGPPGVNLQGDEWQRTRSNQATQHALISARGIVRDHHLNVTTTNGNTTLTVTVERQFSQIGTTSPNQPSWVQKAINESATQTAVRSPDPTDQP
ncbi:hypothetical protein [Halocatena marina]|uniref:hypothetical protein n=1 Tax=Halocatena marina TaxID=2934937 RepID=UPI00200F40B7|nr:hypothetical protein [Halocatena marina]